jgi:hypothetical protein
MGGQGCGGSGVAVGDGVAVSEGAGGGAAHPISKTAKANNNTKNCFVLDPTSSIFPKGRED